MWSSTSIRADAYLGIQSFGKAKQDYPRVLAIDPSNSTARRGLTKLALLNEDIEEASRQVEKSLDLSEADVEALVLKGEISLRQQDFELAEKSFSQALEVVSFHLLARIGLVRALLAQNKPDEALEHIEILTQANPHSAISPYLAALAARQKGDIEGMREALREVLRVAPNHAPSLLMLGAIHYREGSYEQAQTLLSRFAVAQPENLHGKKLLAAVLIKQGELEQALAHLESAREIAPDDAQLLALLGSAYMATRDYEKANQYMEKAAELQPDTAAIRTQLALTHFAAGDVDKGVSELQSAVEADSRVPTG